MNKNFEKMCKKCGISFSIQLPRKYIPAYCSRKCANSHIWNEEDKQKKSQAAKNSEKVLHARLERIEPNKTIQKICVCGSVFTVYVSKQKQKHCSKNCGNKNRIKTPGGYRKGSGRSKTGYYKEIYCGSTYELCWIIYNIDHNISFSRFEGYLQKHNLKYYPDFLIGDKKIVEIKGFERPTKLQAKIDLAQENGYSIEVLFKNDLKIHFEYVRMKYKTNKFHTLYDNYRPIHEYECPICVKQFFREKKSKTNNTFCSQSCSLKNNRLLSPKLRPHRLIG